MKGHNEKCAAIAKRFGTDVRQTAILLGAYQGEIPDYAGNNAHDRAAKLAVAYPNEADTLVPMLRALIVEGIKL